VRNDISRSASITMWSSGAFPRQRAITAGNNDDCISSLTGEMLIGLAVWATDVK